MNEELQELAEVHGSQRVPSLVFLQRSAEATRRAMLSDQLAARCGDSPRNCDFSFSPPAYSRACAEMFLSSLCCGLEVREASAHR